MKQNSFFMKKLNILIFLFCLALTQTNAQRYTTELFSNTSVQQDVIYGVNATVLYYPVAGEAIPEQLLMDVYTPQGDMETSRPLIIYAHTGNFLPHPDNGSPSGTKSDMTAVEICERLAKMGYVVASIDYRKGWNPLATTQDERVFGLINAAYRGVQDARTAIRYFRKDVAENNNSYGIDPNKIVLWGQGTGGYISLAAATLDDYNKVLLPKFITQDQNGNPLPMVIEQVNGDVFGTSVGVNPLDGDTLCYPNHVGFSSDYNLNVNMGGALGDTSWLDPGDMPMISFQAPYDPFAPYAEGTVIVPVNPPLAVVEVQGSFLVQMLQAQWGNNDVFANAPYLDDYTMNANMKNNGFDGLYPVIGTNPQVGDSSPWDFWDPATNPNHANGILTNPDMSAEKAGRYIDTIVGYFTPRACFALDLGCNLGDFVSTREIDAVEAGLTTAPNPASDYVTFQATEMNIQDVYVYDLQGRLVKAHTHIDAPQFEMKRNKLASGVYVAQIRFKDGIVNQKVVFK